MIFDYNFDLIIRIKNVLLYLYFKRAVPKSPFASSLLLLPGLEWLAHLHGCPYQKQRSLEDYKRQFNVCGGCGPAQHAFHVTYRLWLHLLPNLLHVIRDYLQSFKVKTLLSPCK